MGAHDRHHFVPQFYLRNFAFGDKQAQIRLYNIASGRFVTTTSIRKQAQRKRLYGSIERECGLGELESEWSEVVRAIIRRKTVPTRYSEDYHTLVQFVLFQIMRTPTAIAEWEGAGNELAIAVASLHPHVAPHADKIKVQFSDPVAECLQNAIATHPLLLDMYCKVLVNESNRSLITSDHPVIMYNQFMERRQHPGSHTGLSSLGLQMFLPISPRVCLVLYDGNIYKCGGRRIKSSRIDIVSEDAQRLNELQAAHAHSQLFFSNEMCEAEVRKTVGLATKWRRNRTYKIAKYPQVKNADGDDATLLRLSRVDLRVGLTLSAINELKSTRRIRLANHLGHTRNPAMRQEFYQFAELVERGQYRFNEFQQYLKDRIAGRNM